MQRRVKRQQITGCDQAHQVSCYTTGNALTPHGAHAVSFNTTPQGRIRIEQTDAASTATEKKQSATSVP